QNCRPEIKRTVCACLYVCVMCYTFVCVRSDVKLQLPVVVTVLCDCLFECCSFSLSLSLSLCVCVCMCVCVHAGPLSEGTLRDLHCHLKLDGQDTHTNFQRPPT